MSSGTSNHPGSPASSYTDALSFSILSSLCASSDNSTGTGVHFSDLGSTSPRSQALTDDDEDFVLIQAGSNALNTGTPRTAVGHIGGFTLAHESASEEEASGDEGQGRTSDDSDETPSSESDEDEDIVFRGAMAALSVSNNAQASRQATARAKPAQAPVAASPKGKTPAQKASRKAAKLRQKAKRRAASASSSSDESSGNSSSANTVDDAYFSSQMYEEAVAYVTQYLDAPPASPSSPVRLHFLQSLIIELGLLAKGGTALPTSVKAAKTLLKAEAHINVKEYLAWRARRAAAYQAPAAPQGKGKGKKQTAQQLAQKEAQVQAGLAELQKVMFPSKSALKKSLKGTGPSSPHGTTGRMPLNIIKKAGLNVFLVTLCH